MKSTTATIFWAIAPLSSMTTMMFAGYKAMHTTDREQAGWDMILFIAAALLMALLDLNSTKGSWLPKIIAILSILLAIIFGIYYFEGGAGLKFLLGK